MLRIVARPIPLASLFLLLASLACSALIDPFSAPPIATPAYVGIATQTPLLIPATLAPATSTPAILTPTVTPTAPAVSTDTATPSPAVTVAPGAIQRFKMTDETHGWAISEIGILRTDNGGAGWFNVTPPGLPPSNALGGYFADATHAWVILPGADMLSGTLYRTQDGGAHWTSVSVPFAGGDLNFRDANNGSMLADRGVAAGSNAVSVFQTTDGGSTWAQTYTNHPEDSSADSLPFSGDKTGMTFRDALHGWVSGSIPMENTIYFYATADGGQTWARQNVVLPPVEHAMYYAHAAVFFDQNNGFLPATDSASHTMVFFATRDGGATWMPTSIVQAGLYSIVSATDAFVWDGGASLHASHDGMLNWAQVQPNINIATTLAQIQFVSNTTGWALTIDLDGHTGLYKTSDGGSTWTLLTP